MKITLYQNGFLLNDGELRDYESPENKEFMKVLKDKKVPKEIQDQARAELAKTGK
jgi:hypothetical protein